MAARRLTAEEAALWRRVMATVRPSRPEPPTNVDSPGPPNPPTEKPKARVAAAVPAAMPKPAAPQRPRPGTTLDGSWDRRLAGGAVAPDSVIDLHDHTLDTAYAALDAGLDRALARGDRVLLLITGKPPRPESERPHARGRIRAAVGDWLAASRHAARIAAVRAAHPRHGGAGALYIILRRPRNDPKY